MSDLIDRQTAIYEILRLTIYDTVRDLYEATVANKYEDCFEDGIMDAIDVIVGLTSVQPEEKTGRWIPVTERLPGSSGNYLVSVKSIGWNCEEYVVNDIAYWNSSEGFHKADEVVAWMPLPEPYKGGNDGTTD